MLKSSFFISKFRQFLLTLALAPTLMLTLALTLVLATQSSVAVANTSNSPSTATATSNTTGATTAVLASAQLSPLSSAVTQRTIADSNRIANLELTRFLFSQVLQSYIEDGDRFVIESLRGNGPRSYEFLLEKKFFMALLKRWEELLKEPNSNYKSTTEILKSIYSEPGFLAENSFYLNKTLGLDNNHLHNQNIHLSLRPAEEYAVVLGEKRDAMLISFLASESIIDAEKRAQKTLEDMDFFMANTKEDRRICLWIIGFFLNHPSEKISQRAEKVLANIDKNELMDMLADFRWIVLGGSFGLKKLWDLRTQFVGLSTRFPKFNAILEWIKVRLTSKVAFASVITNKAAMAYLSLYRSLRFLYQPMPLAISTSLTGHWAFYESFIKTGFASKSVSEKNNIEYMIKDINETLQSLDMSEASQQYLNANLDTVMLYNADLSKYFPNQEYRKLQNYNPTPLSLLNSAQVFPLKSHSELKKQLQQIINDDMPIKDIDFASAFLQDEYYHNVSNTKVKDLRLLSIAETVYQERLKKIKEILNKNSYKSFSEIKRFSDLQKILTQIAEYLLPNHTYYYIRDSRSFIREMLGEGGNCVSIAMLQLALLAPLWGDDGEWKLGVKFEPNHVLLTVYSKVSGQGFNLDDQETELYRKNTRVYNPKIFLASIIGPEVSAQLLANPSNSYADIDFDYYNLRDDSPIPDVELNNINGLIKQSDSAWLDKLKMQYRNWITNPLENLSRSSQDDKPEEVPEKIPEFKIIENIKPEPNSGKGNESGFADWHLEIAKKLQMLLAQKQTANAAQNSESGNSNFSFADGLSGEANFFGDNIHLLPASTEKSLIPILNGKLGHFWWHGGATSDLFSTQLTTTETDNLAEVKGLYLFVNEPQKNILQQLSSNDFLQILLLSLVEQGKIIGAELTSLDIKTTALFDASLTLSNAGLVENLSEQTEINQSLLKFAVFNYSLQPLVASSSTLCRSDAQAVGPKWINACRSIIIFLNKIGYPKTVREAYADGAFTSLPLEAFPPRGTVQLPLDETPIEVNLLLNTLLRGASLESTSLSIFPEFLKKSLFLKKLAYQSILKQGIGSYELHLVKMRTGRHNNEFFILPFADSKYQSSLSNKYEFASPEYVTNEPCLFPDTIDKQAKLNLLTKTPPTQFRTNLRLGLLPLQELQCETKFVANSFHSLLQRSVEPWQLVLPKIQYKKCRGGLAKAPQGISLPKINNDICKQLPNGNIAEGVICMNDSGSPEQAGINDSTIEVCSDPRSNYNFEVSNVMGDHEQPATARYKIPLENFLSIHADPYSQKEYATLPAPLQQVVKQKFIKAETYAVANDEYVDGINMKVLEHIKKYWPYYSLYWSTEINKVCQELAGPEHKTYLKNVYPERWTFLKNNICLFSEL